MRVPTLLLGALLLATAAPAFAQDDDAPIPYSNDEDDTPKRKLPPRSDPTQHRTEETEVEKKDRDESLAGLDDPTIGWGADLMAGLMLIDSSRGGLWEPHFAAGARVTWEFGRLFFNEALRDGLFADLTWDWASAHDGTTLINEDTNYHFFTLAPAFGFPVAGPDFLIYGQLGGGVVLQTSTLHYDTRSSTLTAFKPAIVYGVGFRGRPLVSPDGLLRIAFRVELTRYHRHYMDDTYLGAGVGVTF